MASKAFDDYPRPSVAVDVVCLTVVGGELQVLLYQRTIPPQKGALALPGGFVQIEESLEAAAARLLRDKAGLEDVFIEQLQAFGAPGRDPRGRVISIAHLALLEPSRFATATARHVPLSAPVTLPADARLEVPGAELFLDHGRILAAAVRQLRARLDETACAFQLLPERFTLRALQEVHEAIRGKPLNKDSFRRRLMATDTLVATGEWETDVLHRPAELHRFRGRPTPARRHHAQHAAHRSPA